jgi:hypothetical protein
MAAPKPLDVVRLKEALELIESGKLGEAADKIAPLVRAKRFTRPSRINPEALEVDEVKGWIQTAIDDPAGEDARFYVERAYYKLRTQRSADAS